jgi:tetratricopeptide (TPR) repeat protein
MEKISNCRRIAGNCFRVHITGFRFLFVMLFFLVLDSQFLILNCFSADSAQVLWGDAGRETDSNIVDGKLREIVRKYPDNPIAVDAQYLIAEHKYMEEDYTRAYREFRILVEKYRRNKYLSLAWYRRACCLSAIDKHGEAINEFRQSLSLDSQSEQSILAKIGIADEYFISGDYQKAVEEYKSILPGNPFRQHILYKITLCHKNLCNAKEFKISREDLGKNFPMSLEYALIKNVQEPNITVKQFSLDVVGSNETAVPVNIPAETAWTIQVGSFTKEDNARNLSADLIKKGYVSWIQPVKTGEGFFYRVYLGKFDNERETKKKAEEIKGKESLPARIVELK